MGVPLKTEQRSSQGTPRTSAKTFHFKKLERYQIPIDNRKQNTRDSAGKRGRGSAGRAMFFFIAGIQPKTVELDAPSRVCPKCGLNQARLKRVDHYLSLFFIPLFPVKRGRPFLECRSCAGVFTETGQPWHEPSPKGPPSCPACGRPLDASFRYCPSCGQPVR
jgi:hypothetical protein